MNEVIVTMPVLASHGEEPVRDAPRLGALDGVRLDVDYTAHVRVAQACTVSLVHEDRLELEVHWFTHKALAPRTLESLRKQTWALILDGVDGYEVDGLWVAANALGTLDEVTVRQQPGDLPLVLTHAARRGNRDEVERALADGQPLDQRDSDGKTALHLAYEHAHLELAPWLIFRGAPLEARDDQGRTPLLAAMTCLYLNPETRGRLVDELLAHGADPHVVDGFRSDALCEAARAGDLALVERFLDLGLDPNRRGHEGRTAAMVTSSPEILERLLDHGIDRGIRDDEGRTLDAHVRHQWEQAKTTRFGYPETYEPLLEILARHAAESAREA